MQLRASTLESGVNVELRLLIFEILDGIRLFNLEQLVEYSFDVVTQVFKSSKGYIYYFCQTLEN